MAELRSRISVYLFILIALLLFMYGWRLAYSSSFARSWDEVDFALALTRFDLLAMQPHFPGYPYFILGGMIIHRWVPDPAKALSVFNVLMSALSTIPIYLLARKELSKAESILVTFCIQAAAYYWVLSSQPMSEGAAISVLWWYLWSLDLANRRRTRLTQIVPLFLFSMLMGIRLSYFIFGLGIIYLWLKDSRENQGYGYRLRWGIYLILAAFFQLIWVTGLVMSEGSWTGFIELSLHFIKGHFTEWGGSALSHPEPLLNRWFVLFFYNFLWMGLCGQSILAAIGLIILMILIIADMIRFGYHGKDFRHYYEMISLLYFYFIYAWIAQNIEKPRHIAPLIGPSLLLIYMVAMRSGKKVKLKLGLLALLAGVQFFTGMTLTKEQATETPATYQLAEYLETIPHPVLVYTWEETRVMQYLQAPYDHKRIFSYELFAEDTRVNEGKRIFLTNAVVEGFKRQGVDVSGKIRRVRHFSSNPLFDPVYHDITLYEWMAGER